MKFLVAQLMKERVLVELDVNRLRPAAVHDSGDLPRVAQAAARTPSLHLARLRYDFDCHDASDKCGTRDQVPR